MGNNNNLPGIPANVEAERAVLGSILIDPDAINKIGFLQPADFYREQHEWLFEAMRALSGRAEPIDFVTLSDALERAGKLAEAGGPAFLTELIERTPTALFIEHYARIVERCALYRRLIAAAGKIAELAYAGGEDAGEVISKAANLFFGVTDSLNNKSGPQSMETLLQRTFDKLERVVTMKAEGIVLGLPSGYTMLDRLLGGFQRSDLIIIAGRPGMGKSSFGLSIVANAARRYGARGLIFSLEMSASQLTERWLSMETAIDSSRIRLGHIQENEWPILYDAANALAGATVWIDDTPAASVNEIRAKARRIHAEHGLDFILVDYLQLMAGSGAKDEANRQQEISYISRSLKALARELDVPVLALSQLSRSVESRADKRPMLSDLRESGAIEQDSDVVIFIYREDYYVEDTARQNIADILVAKHRHGATGTVSLYFRKELTQFRDLEIERYELEAI